MGMRSSGRQHCRWVARTSVSGNGISPVSSGPSACVWHGGDGSACVWHGGGGSACMAWRWRICGKGDGRGTDRLLMLCRAAACSLVAMPFSRLQASVDKWDSPSVLPAAVQSPFLSTRTDQVLSVYWNFATFASRAIV